MQSPCLRFLLVVNVLALFFNTTLYHVARRPTLLLTWPTVPLPEFRGSDERPLMIVRALATRGWTVDFLAAHNTLFGRERIVGRRHASRLYAAGVRRIRRPIRMQTTQSLRRMISSYNWVWLSDWEDLLETSVQLVRFIVETHLPTKIAFHQEDPGVALRALSVSHPTASFERLQSLHEGVLTNASHPLHRLATLERELQRRANLHVAITRPCFEVATSAPGARVLLPYGASPPVDGTRRRRGHHAVFISSGTPSIARWFERLVRHSVDEGQGIMVVAGNVQKLLPGLCRCRVADPRDGSYRCRALTLRVMCAGFLPREEQVDALLGSARVLVNALPDMVGVSTKSVRALGLGTPVLTTPRDGTFERAHPFGCGVHVCGVGDWRCFRARMRYFLSAHPDHMERETSCALDRAKVFRVDDPMAATIARMSRP